MKAIVMISMGLNAVLMSAAAPFQNLDFEGTPLPLLPPGQPGGTSIPIAQAFPGWMGYYGTTPINVVSYNQLPAGSAALVLLSGAIEGNFSAALIPGFHPDHGINTPVVLAQTGLVPSDAQSIRFVAVGSAPFPPNFTVSLDGQSLAWMTLEQGTSGPIYGADVSSFAGRTVELSFSSGPRHILYFDAVSFSPVPVPEPSTWALFSAGLLCLAGFVRNRGIRS